MHKTYIYSAWQLRLVILIHAVGELRAAEYMGLSYRQFQKRCADWSFATRESGSLADYITVNHYRKLPEIVGYTIDASNAMNLTKARYEEVCDYLRKYTRVILAEKAQDACVEEISYQDLYLLVSDALNVRLDSIL